MRRKRGLGRKSGISKHDGGELHQPESIESILATARPIWTVLPETPAAYLSSGDYLKQFGWRLWAEQAMLP